MSLVTTTASGVTLVIGAALVVTAVTATTFRAEAGEPGVVGASTRRVVVQGPYNWRGAQIHALLSSVWYPAASGTAATEQLIGPPDAPLFVGGRWAPGAAPAPGKHPLILLSHGTGGTPESLAWLGSGLAAHGYVVAGVNHPGNNALEPYTLEGFLVWWERAHDLSVLLDFLLKDPELGPLIDARRVGAAGFSLGGYTVFELAGARTDPAKIQAFCRSPEAEGCGDPPEFPNLWKRWSELQASSADFRDVERTAIRSHRDPRIRAGFAVAPAIAQSFVPASLHDVTIPIHVVVGTADTLAPPRTNAQYLAGAIPSVSATLVPNAVHYTFLDRCTEAGRTAMPHLCTDPAGVSREAVHQSTLEEAVSFFDRALR